MDTKDSDDGAPVSDPAGKEAPDFLYANYAKGHELGGLGWSQNGAKDA